MDCILELFSGGRCIHTFQRKYGDVNVCVDPQRNQRKPVSDLVLMLGPFIMDCANAWTTRNGVVPQRCPKFDQRVKYFDMLHSVDNSGMWYSGILEAANSTLGNV